MATSRGLTLRSRLRAWFSTLTRSSFVTNAPPQDLQRSATTAITCPSCGEETTRRQWGIGTLVYVDVCIECRGVWLDVGELDQLEGRPPG
jgi:predicted RNA-binding Zn-ribbon protein involved in translation (DUF1610 family)